MMPDNYEGTDFSGAGTTLEIQKDEKGRALPAHMTDRELAEETVLTLRAIADAVSDAFSQLQTHPMAKMLGLKSKN